MDAVKNFAIVTVSQGYDAAATSIALSTGDGAKLPAPATDGKFNLIWYNATDYSNPADDPNVEIVRCTARSADTLTITRAQESTSATVKNTADKTYKMVLGMTKKKVNDMEDDGGWKKPIKDDGDLETWTYASATTFTISGDKTGKYQKGDKLKLTNSTVKYPTVKSVSYTSPNTTITIENDVVLANAAITSPYYSKAYNPQGHEWNEGWHTVQTFLNSWVNHSPDIFNSAAYFKDLFGVVHLKGLVKDGTIGQAIFTLPEGYRPSKRELFVTISTNAIGKIYIHTDGNVSAEIGNNTYFSLDGVTFRADGY